MYWDDHSPPHFHAKYDEYEVTVEIQTDTLIAGTALGINAVLLSRTTSECNRMPGLMVENWCRA
jgi:hypothetical protein